MTSRVLRSEEYARLVGTEAEAVIPLLRPETRVVVVEDDAGVIVGCHVLQPVLHAECLWVHPEHRRRTSVPRRLWRAVQREVREWFHADGFVTASASAEVDDLLRHVGAQPIPARFFAVPVQGD